ncbi:MAG: PT domain-containing protein [Phycisphaerales bacterium]|nr:PT domain-containing protein [Phycisphaerales bacterium]
MRRQLILIVCLLSSPNVGCSYIFQKVVHLQPEGDEQFGITYYVGGAGPIGNIGSFDVPGGLRDAGYKGRVEVHTWQSWNHAGDQMDLRRNQEKAAELADKLRQYRRRYPRNEINIIALSAGSGIAAFALEFLPEGIGVNKVFFCSCSLSSRYDLTRALKRIKSRLYVLYSPHDQILKNLVWHTGTVDRSDGREGIAGLEGFRMPSRPRRDTLAQYEKVQNIPHRFEFAGADYDGGHTDVTERAFVGLYLAPALMGNDRRLLGPHPEIRYKSPPPPSPVTPTTRPTSRPAAEPTSRPTSRPTTRPTSRPASQPAEPEEDQGDLPKSAAYDYDLRRRRHGFTP